MDFYSLAPIATALDAAYAVVTALADTLQPLTGALSAALAIVIITLALRTVLIPVGASQVRAEFTRRRIAPQVAELRRKYSKNPELLQKKMLELYTSEKASPLAGMLPTLLQAPVLSLVYGLFILPTVNGHSNALLDQHLFGVPLGTSLMHLVGGAGLWPGVVVFAALLAAIAAVALASRRAALRFTPIVDDAAPAALRLGAVLSWLPLITVVFASLVPLAATLYLSLTTAWTLVERSVLRRRLA